MEREYQREVFNQREYLIKGVFNSKVKPLYTTFLHSIKLSEYRIRR